MENSVNPDQLADLNPNCFIITFKGCIPVLQDMGETVTK